MQGQKQMYMFLMFIIFILAFHFCRKAIKRDKELKQHRDDALKRKIESDIIEQKLKIQRILQEQEIKRQHDIIDRMKEQKDKCYDLYIFANKPNLDLEMEVDKHNVKNPITNVANDNEMKTKDKIDKIKQKPKKNMTFSEPIIYLFVLVLIYFLIKAATDITQHFKNKTELDKNDDGRRYSLHDYAERKNSKVPITTLNRRSILTSMDKYPKPIASQSFEERRISRIFPEQLNKIGSGIATEPVTPTKINLLLGSNKQSQLIRRCSVPAFSQFYGQVSLRRPSIDSYSEGDSSPDIKRRVRMIHRH